MRISDWSSDVCSSDLDAVLSGDAELQALGDPPRPLEAVLGRRRRADRQRRLLEQRQPAVEMRTVHRQRHVRAHRLAAVAPGRPEEPPGGKAGVSTYKFGRAPTS